MADFGAATKMRLSRSGCRRMGPHLRGRRPLLLATVLLRNLPNSVLAQTGDGGKSSWEIPVFCSRDLRSGELWVHLNDRPPPNMANLTYHQTSAATTGTIEDRNQLWHNGIGENIQLSKDCGPLTVDASRARARRSHAAADNIAGSCRERASRSEPPLSVHRPGPRVLR